MSLSLSSALAGTNGAADALKSKQAGHLIQCERPQTLADGLRGRLGDLTWPIVRDFVDDIISVSEQEIIDAMQLCFERMKVWLHAHARELSCLRMPTCLEVPRQQPCLTHVARRQMLSSCAMCTLMVCGRALKSCVAWYASDMLHDGLDM